MGLLIKIVIIAVIVVLVLFVLTFGVYFFNLDMKMMAAVEPLLKKVYDRRKRERKI